MMLAPERYWIWPTRPSGKPSMWMINFSGSHGNTCGTLSGYDHRAGTLWRPRRRQGGRVCACPLHRQSERTWYCGGGMRPTHRSFGTSIHLGIYHAIRPPGKVDRATISLAMAGGDPGNDAHVPLSNGAFMLSPDFAVAISWGV